MLLLNLSSFQFSPRPYDSVVGNRPECLVAHGECSCGFKCINMWMNLFLALFIFCIMCAFTYSHIIIYSTVKVSADEGIELQIYLHGTCTHLCSFVCQMCLYISYICGIFHVVFNLRFIATERHHNNYLCCAKAEMAKSKNK